MRLPRPRLADPGLTSLKSAARAAIVMPAVFAIAYQLIGEPQTATFASFGSFAMLVLVDFSGPPASRFTAYLTLAVAGSVLVVIGTLCSENAWLAAAAMAVVGFVILFSGAINGYLAAGGTAAIFAFVLPVSIPAPLSEVGWRLAGWGLAAGAGICAVMLLWPPRRSGSLRADAARACLALADLADCALAGDQEVIGHRAEAAQQAVDGLRGRFQAAAHRSTGPTAQATALAALIEEAGWLLDSLRSLTGPLGTDLCRAENSAALAATAAALRASGGRLTGSGDPPDTGRLEQAQHDVAQALVRRIGQLPAIPADEAMESLVGRSFRTRVITNATRQLAGYALTASGDPPAAPHGPAADSGPPDWPDRARRAGSEPRRAGAVVQRLAPPSGAMLAVGQFATEHASARSVSFRNSVRGAAGLAVAVFIAQRSGLQHSFWVVLGTLSVLRSNALGTGRSILSALAGTAAGIAVGAAILVAVGASYPVLWGVLPVAVLVAAYAPRVISFAVGQAGFTVVLVVLFNIIQPSGWKVGLIRIEDVAIGFAVSLGVGLVFWPRGAAAVLRQNMAAAYSRAADYVGVTARLLTGGGDPGDSGRADQLAQAAVHQLDDAYRQYLAEQSAKRMNPESAARLVAGAGRVLRAGRSMAALAEMMARHRPSGSHGPDGDRQDREAERRPAEGAILAVDDEILDARVQAVRSWYVTLGDCLANGTSVPPPQSPDPANRHRLLTYVRDAVASGQASARHRALLVLWASQHLEMLVRMESHLGDQALAASGAGQRTRR